jgi:hypothetical protein
MVRDDVDRVDKDLLHRAADPLGEPGWIALLQGNQAAQPTIAEDFLASHEFFDRSVAGTL